MENCSNTAILENDIIKAVFDTGTGAFISFENIKTRWKIQNRPELALSFRMLVPLPGRRNNLISGEKQGAVLFREEKDRFVFTWKDLRSEHGGIHNITLKCSVTLDENGLTFDSEILNNSQYPVETLSYPCIGDVSIPSGEEKLSRINYFYTSMYKGNLLPAFSNERGYFGVDNPIQMVPTPDNPFVLTAGEKQGLYAGCHDTSCKELVQFTYELKPGYKESIACIASSEGEISGIPVHMEFSAIHYPFIAQGESGVLSPIVLNPYIGSWHYGVDCYKNWRSTWYTPPHTPEWAKDVHSWHQIHINSPEDELRCRYKDLVKYGEACAKHGVKAIQLVGWNDGGQDRGNPSHDTDSRLGTWDELKDAIAKIQDMGVKMILFNKYTWADRSQEWFRNELVKYAMKDPYGDYNVFMGYQYQTPVQLANINTRRLIPMCMNSKEWREICCNEFKKSIELGAAGMLYDECQHHGTVNYCFDQDHGHHVPAHVYAGDELLSRDFDEIVKKEYHDYLISGESCYDYEFRYYSVSYFRIFNTDHVALQRYIDPYAGLMLAVTGFDDRNTLNQCLMYRYIISYEPYNFKGELDDFPLTMEYGIKIDTLRRKYKNYLWDAEFIDTKEAQVFVQGKLHFPYSVFKQASTGKRAVVASNFDENKEIEANVRLENFSGSFVAATPEQQESKKTNGVVTIPPRSVAVLMEV